MCALTTAYVTAEPFIDYDYDIRIQKIGARTTDFKEGHQSFFPSSSPAGQHFRAFHRRGMNWKGFVRLVRSLLHFFPLDQMPSRSNVGTAIIEDAPMTPEYQLWIDEASSYFGGLDICALDVLHRASDGAHFILEVRRAVRCTVAPRGSQKPQSLPLTPPPPSPSSSFVSFRVCSIIAKRLGHRPGP